MKTRTIEKRRVKLSETFEAEIKLEEHWAHGLGTWRVYSWIVWENKSFVASSSYAQGEEYCCFADVIDQLEYCFIRSGQMEEIVSDTPSDADPGL